MITANPLLDKQFIVDLSEQKNRILFARITSLTHEEKPVEYIEGKVTGGSINIDGASAVRRTCSLSMVAKDVNINEFYWGFNNKFKLEIGLFNDINLNYEDIIWFPMGLYIITSFNTSTTANNYNINISGKDKMCLLNGEVGGAIPHSVDFGITEYYDKLTNTTTYEKVLIKDIIREGVQNFGNELPQNIIINDIEECGVEIIEYKGDEPLYLYRNIDQDIIENMSFGNQEIYIENEGPIAIKDAEIIFDNFTEDLIEDNEKPTEIHFDGDDVRYTLIKLEYGSICGYRETDLVYAGELISNVGESITSILDKIVSMLGQFEYFYDLDGRFVFQKKAIYLDSVWNDLDIDEEIGQYRQITYDYSFTDSNLITSFNNTPNLLNVRNDFTVWGTKIGSSGAELPIHIRYAIDKKPTIYTSIRHLLNEDEVWDEGMELKTYSSDEYDWRELIYQMALDYRRCYHNDDFLYYLNKYNPWCSTGKTGYEQYYIDLEGFWRQLYDPTKGQEYINEVMIEKEKEMEKYNSENSSSEISIADNKLKETKEKLLKALNDEKIFIYVPSSSKWSEDDVFKKDGEIKSANDASEKVLKDLRTVLEDVETNYRKLYNEIKETDKDSLENLELAYEQLVGDIAVLQANINSALSAFKTAARNRDAIDNAKTNQEAYYDSLINAEMASWDDDSYWNRAVIDSPSDLLFWFDFIDGPLAQFSNYAIGNRPKAEKDDNVKTIIYSDIPNVVFKTKDSKDYEREPGYTYISIPQYMYNVFSISSMAKSGKEVIDDMLYKFGYCNESVSIQAIPVYFLEPNTRIFIRDEKSKIEGDYIVDKITIPLNSNGLMSITATKAVSSIK